jgi:hypothetical protein
MSSKFTKFGNLFREDQLDLVNHALNEGKIEYLSAFNEWESKDSSGCIQFYMNSVYRKGDSELTKLMRERDALNVKIAKLQGKGK